MSNTEDKKEYFKKLAEKYPIEERYKNLLTQIQDVVESLGIMEYIQINTALLGQAVLDYFEDIDRVKEYEGIDKINVDKIYAYETFWLLKRKPIQIVNEDKSFQYLHINEKVFTFILIAKLLVEMGKGYDDQNEKIFSFIELIYYNFKYRLFSQKTIELMISGFFCGCCFI